MTRGPIDAQFNMVLLLLIIVVLLGKALASDAFGWELGLSGSEWQCPIDATAGNETLFIE